MSESYVPIRSPTRLPHSPPHRLMAVVSCVDNEADDSLVLLRHLEGEGAVDRKQGKRVQGQGEEEGGGGGKEGKEKVLKKLFITS